MLQNIFFFFVIFRHVVFAFTCFFFFLICSHEPTEKGLRKWLFQGGNREIFFFFFKKCSSYLIYTVKLITEKDWSKKEKRKKTGKEGGREKTRDWFPIDLYLDSVSLS